MTMCQYVCLSLSLCVFACMLKYVISSVLNSAFRRASPGGREKDSSELRLMIDYVVCVSMCVSVSVCVCVCVFVSLCVCSRAC